MTALVLLDDLKQFVANQKDLPDDINQIVNDNFWELF